MHFFQTNSSIYTLCSHATSLQPLCSFLGSFCFQKCILELFSQPLCNSCRIFASELVKFLRLTRSKRVNLHCLLLCGLLGASFLQPPCSFLDTFGFKTCVLELCSHPPCNFLKIFCFRKLFTFEVDAPLSCFSKAAWTPPHWPPWCRCVVGKPPAFVSLPLVAGAGSLRASCVVVARPLPFVLLRLAQHGGTVSSSVACGMCR